MRPASDRPAARAFRICRESATSSGCAGLVLALMLALPAVASAQSQEQIARGKYIFGAAAGCACHTAPKQALNAGGRKYDGPFGTVYSSNITPDPTTGIGKWTDEQIITAIRAGRRPNGERLIPVHPYTVFNGMAEQDLKDLVAYLRSVPPVNKPTPAKKIAVPMFESVFLPAWLATFAARETPPPSAPTSGLARGEYLVRAVGHCGECHTPRSGITMALDNGRFLAGNPKSRGPEGSAVPNITPDRDTGIGAWTEEQIAEYLGTGNKPDGDVAGGLMAQVIEGSAAGYKDLTQADRLAIAKYLKSVPPIKNRIE
jgi:mono/diheme cytochrome c family protein